MAHESYGIVARDLLWILNASEMSQIPAKPDIVHVQRRYCLALSAVPALTVITITICPRQKSTTKDLAADRARSLPAPWLISLLRPPPAATTAKSANTNTNLPFFSKNFPRVRACCFFLREKFLAARLPASFPAGGVERRGGEGERATRCQQEMKRKEAKTSWPPSLYSAPKCSSPSSSRCNGYNFPFSRIAFRFPLPRHLLVVRPP